MNILEVALSQRLLGMFRTADTVWITPLLVSISVTFTSASFTSNYDREIHYISMTEHLIYCTRLT